MFNKQPAKPGQIGHSSDLTVFDAPSAPTARKSGPRVASLLAEDITIDGNLRGDGDTQVDGAIHGDVMVARLSIGESGRIEGSIQAEVVEVRGRVTGAITAKQVRLYASAHVDGDITHEQLTMEAGAYFEGRSLRLQRPAAAASGDVIDIASAG
jgi:cytoskeletal protein CcmA (bactofilin family)